MCEIYINLLLNTIHPILCYLVVLSGWVDIYSGHDFVAWFQYNLHSSRIHKYSIEICQPNWFFLFSEIPLLPSAMIQFYIFSRLGKTRGCSTSCRLQPLLRIIISIIYSVVDGHPFSLNWPLGWFSLLVVMIVCLSVFGWSAKL